MPKPTIGMLMYFFDLAVFGSLHHILDTPHQSPNPGRPHGVES